MNGLRTDVDGATLVHNVGDTIYLILGAALQDDLQFQLMVPVAGEAAVWKYVEVIHKFCDGEHLILVGQLFQQGMVDAVGIHVWVVPPLIPLKIVRTAQKSRGEWYKNDNMGGGV